MELCCGSSSFCGLEDFTSSQLALLRCHNVFTLDFKRESQPQIRECLPVTGGGGERVAPSQVGKQTHNNTQAEGQIQR